MKTVFRNRWFFALPALLLAFGLIAAGCGDDDDDDDDTGDTTTTATGTGETGDDTTATATEEGDDVADDPAGSGEDAEYVHGICSAYADLQTAFTDALTEVDPEATEEEVEDAVISAIVAALGDLGDTLEGLDAPDDISEFHGNLTEAIRTAEDRIGSEDFDITGDEDPFEGFDQLEPPADVEEKYQPLAEAEPACSGLDVFDPTGAGAPEE